MKFIDRLSRHLKRHPKRIVFPEGDDPRILRAAHTFARLKLGIPILIGNREQIENEAAISDITLSGIRLLQPDRSDEIENFTQKLRTAPPYQKLTNDEARRYILDPHYFATLLLASSGADALVTGSCAPPSTTLRPIRDLIPLQSEVKTLSSMLVLDTPNHHIGNKGVLFLADCGVVSDPTIEQLADIAVTVGVLSHHLTDVTARVALLGYTTQTSQMGCPLVSKVKAATRLAKERATLLENPIDIEGELQVDAALHPRIAAQKNTVGPVAGKANVLIFPNIASGNIASKMLPLVSNDIYSYGRILTGLSKPAAELNRGAAPQDIFGAAVIVGCQAVDHRFLFGPSIVDAL